MALSSFKPAVRKRIEAAFKEKFGETPELKKESKYKNVKTTVDGITHDSGKECTRWHVLKMLEKSGYIQALKRQVPYDLIVNGVKIAVYKADFTYREDGAFVVEDSKGMRTKEYILKKKLMLALHGIAIKET